MKFNNLFLTAALSLSLAQFAWAAQPPKMKMTTDIPESITTQDSVETRMGTLKFFDGFPGDATFLGQPHNLRGKLIIYRTIFYNILWLSNILVGTQPYPQ